MGGKSVGLHITSMMCSIWCILLPTSCFLLRVKYKIIFSLYVLRDQQSQASLMSLYSQHPRQMGYKKLCLLMRFSAHDNVLTCPKPIGCCCWGWNAGVIFCGLLRRGVEWWCWRPGTPRPLDWHEDSMTVVGSRQRDGEDLSYCTQNNPTMNTTTKITRIEGCNERLDSASTTEVKIFEEGLSVSSAVFDQLQTSK